MSNLAVQNTPFDEETSQEKKASNPTAPSDIKAARKASGAFRTISEVADELDVQQHVLRFWETKFTQVKPLKRGGGRRYYRPEDVALLKHIHHLLYTEGYTIKGVQKLLKGQGRNQIAAQVMAAEDDVPSAAKVRSATVANNSANNGVAQTEAPATPVSPAQSGNVYDLSSHQRVALEKMLEELKALRALFPKDAA